MIIKNREFYHMANEIKMKQLRIVIFGAGVIGRITVPEILKEFDLVESVECYIDNNSLNWNKKILVGKEWKPILGPDVLKNYNETQIVVLLAISRCHEVLIQLEEYTNLQNAECYIIPMMCISNFQYNNSIGAMKEYELPVIPKVIHYMWLGGSNIPQYLEKCIESWYEFCPEYEIRRWDESNYDIHKNVYMSQAYRAGKYGFVPDYARLDILYNYGGIYMDTDVQLLKPLDDMLYQDAFCGVEKWQTLNFGGCSGAVKGNKFIKKLLDKRENLSFINKDGSFNLNTCGYYDTFMAIENGYKVIGENQKILDMNIYSSDYFHPYDYMSGMINRTLNTYSIHHFNGGWLDEKSRQENDRIRNSYSSLYLRATQI